MGMPVAARKDDSWDALQAEALVRLTVVSWDVQSAVWMVAKMVARLDEVKVVSKVSAMAELTVG